MSKHKIVIEPNSKIASYWKDIWSYRGLFYFLSWRDILVRYKQTSIGILWSVLRPLLTIIVFTVVFNKLGNFNSEGSLPYAIMVCAGMLPWQFFSNSFSETSNSLIANSNLLTKVYFPRLIVPASSIITSLLDFFISFVILAALMVWYKFVPGWQIILLPVFLIWAVVVSLGAGLFVAALNVKYRDFRYIIPFVVQFGLYISPVGFSSKLIYENKNLPIGVKYLYSLNPIVGVIDGFRWCIQNNDVGLFWPGLIISIVISIIMFWGGIRYFRASERKFADII